MARKTKEIREQNKLMEIQRQASVQCQCTNRVPLKAFRIFVDYSVCNWCGRRVYKDKEKQKKYDEQLKKETFEKQLKQYLKRSSENENNKRGKRNTRKA